VRDTTRAGSVNESKAQTSASRRYERRAASVTIPDNDGAGIEKGQNDGQVGSGATVWKPPSEGV